MKINYTHIKIIVIFAIMAILGIQAVWLYNMYISYRDATHNRIVQTLSLSIDEELAYRMEHLGGPISSYYYPDAKDTAQIVTSKIITADTTIVFSYEKNDIYSERKIHQLEFKFVYPLNINHLDSLFHQSLIEDGIPVEKMAIEFYDKNTDATILTDSLVKDIRFQEYETERIYVDILNSIGIKAYVQTSYYTIFRKMALQLVLSAVLIIAAVGCLFHLSKTIFRQRKEKIIKQDFVDTMTHELKKPISTSILVLDYLVLKNSSSENELLATALLELRKLNTYVEKIQEISRGEEGSIQLTKARVALLPFFQKLKEKYEIAEEKQVCINLQLESDLYLSTDILHFSNIMENLTENSIKYSGESVSIDILVSQKNGQIQIIHRDNGWGISKTEINHIFEKFYRGRVVEKRRKPGFGLGLSYIQIMVEKMGGSISVLSKENNYTEFTLLFDNE